MAGVDFKLYLISDRRLCGTRTLIDVLQQAQRAGVKAIQLREKDLTAGAFYDLACRARQVCPADKVRLFINGRVDVARAIAADGVQLTEQSLPVAPARAILGNQALIGVSTHSLAQVKEATRQQCDFILFGPVFSTPSKLKYGQPQGLAKLEAVANATFLPVFAVGGIDHLRAKQCLEHGAYGVAVISFILTADNISEAVNRLIENL